MLIETLTIAIVRRFIALRPFWETGWLRSFVIGICGLFFSYPIVATQNDTAMNPETLKFLNDVIHSVNPKVLKQRKEYYEYLVSRGEQDGSLEEHIEMFATLAKLGKPASEQDIEAIKELSGPALPVDLIAFYRSVGSFEYGAKLFGAIIVLHAPQDILERSKPDYGKPWNKVRSLGLVDMMGLSMGNDQPEFDPESKQGFTHDDVKKLNGEYSVIGWRPDGGGDGFRYLYFDRRGRFGVLFYHQDDFDAIYEKDLRPMLLNSPADMSFHDALVSFIGEALGLPKTRK